MSQVIEIVVRVGPHDEAAEFADQIMGEIEYMVLNEKEIDGCPVTWTPTVVIE